MAEDECSDWSCHSFFVRNNLEVALKDSGMVVLEYVPEMKEEKKTSAAKKQKDRTEEVNRVAVMTPREAEEWAANLATAIDQPTQKELKRIKKKERRQNKNLQKQDIDRKKAEATKSKEVEQRAGELAMGDVKHVVTTIDTRQILHSNMSPEPVFDNTDDLDYKIPGEPVLSPTEHGEVISDLSDHSVSDGAPERSVAGHLELATTDISDDLEENNDNSVSSDPKCIGQEDHDISSKHSQMTKRSLHRNENRSSLEHKLIIADENEGSPAELPITASSKQHNGNSCAKLTTDVELENDCVNEPVIHNETTTVDATDNINQSLKKAKKLWSEIVTAISKSRLGEHAAMKGNGSDVVNFTEKGKQINEQNKEHGSQISKKSDVEHAGQPGDTEGKVTETSEDQNVVREQTDQSMLAPITSQELASDLELADQPNVVNNGNISELFKDDNVSGEKCDQSMVPAINNEELASDQKLAYQPNVVNNDEISEISKEDNICDEKSDQSMVAPINNEELASDAQLCANQKKCTIDAEFREKVSAILEAEKLRDKVGSSISPANTDDRLQPTTFGPMPERYYKEPILIYKPKTNPTNPLNFHLKPNKFCQGKSAPASATNGVPPGGAAQVVPTMISHQAPVQFMQAQWPMQPNQFTPAQIIPVAMNANNEVNGSFPQMASPQTVPMVMNGFANGQSPAVAHPQMACMTVPSYHAVSGLPPPPRGQLVQYTVTSQVASVAPVPAPSVGTSPFAAINYTQTDQMTRIIYLCRIAMNLIDKDVPFGSQEHKARYDYVHNLIILATQEVWKGNYATATSLMETVERYVGSKPMIL